MGERQQATEVAPATLGGDQQREMAAVGEAQDRVSVGWQRNLRLGDEQAAGHSEVDEKFNRALLLLRAAVCDGHHDGLAYAADAVDSGAGQRVGDLGLGRLEGLRLAAGPDAGDALAVNARLDAVGDGFDFRKFRHVMRRSWKTGCRWLGVLCIVCCL